MKPLPEPLSTEGVWKKLGNQKGVLIRTVTAQEREETVRREQRNANSKEGKLGNLRLVPIPISDI